MSLTHCVENQVWGGRDIISADPGVEEHRDIYGLPYLEGKTWGLFDREDRPIEIAVDRAWPDARANRCISESNTSYSAVRQTLPDDVEYVYGGVYHAHFGHYVLETLSRLWPLVEGLRSDQRLLMHGPANIHNWWASNYVRGTLSALGLSLDKIVQISAPTRIRRVLIPAQSFRVNAFAHTAYRRLCHVIGERLTGQKRPPRNVRPVFLSKALLTNGVTGIINEPLLVEELQRHGVEIIYPEQLNLMSKIELYKRRKVISGWATSAQHISIFAPPSARMQLMIGGVALNSNCILIDRLNENDTRYWDADLEHVKVEDNSFLNRWAFRDPVQIAHNLLDRL